MSQTKISIVSPHGADIVGILQQARPLERTQGRPIALIIHGVLAHKDQLYHKRLAEAFVKERGMDSMRYDMRGQGGETEGPWDQSNFDDDADDLETVIAYLVKTYGYHVHSLIGHSRGSIVCGLYLSTRMHTPIKFFVNLSGRYDHSRFLQNKNYLAAFAKDGYYDWDSKTVPIEDAWDFHRIFSQRNPGSHTIKTEPGAGHNWVRPFDEPVNGIMQWLTKVDPLGPERSKL
ncbi:hypothetical protein RQP46_009930 [Phenoliferia psychrophenolica]